MSSSVSSPDTFLDRWGHFVLWMGPYIFLVSVLAWTPRLALCLCAVELMQFTLHIREHHSEHPMTPISALFVGAAFAMYVVGSLFYPISLWAYLLMFCQIGFSMKVHDWIHSRDIDDLLGTFVAGFCSLGPIAVLIMGHTVPGFPGFFDLHAYLFTG